MVRSRDHRAVTRRTREQGQALLQAWAREREARRRMDNVVACAQETNLVHYLDGRPGPVRCELVADHARPKHKARLGGGQWVEWDDQSVELVLEVRA